MAKLRQRVLTIHGVNPDRGWQERVKSVLEPHFECTNLNYPGYDGPQGPIRIICAPALAALSAFLCAVSALISFGANWRAALVPIRLAFVAFVAGLVMAAVQRRQWGQHIKVQLSSLCSSLPRPHIIAHSFGTYLIGRSLKYPDIEFDRMVLVGSVLPRGFDWRALCTSDRHAFRETRNEVGIRDYAVWAADRTHWLTWDVGGAGLRGFRPGLRGFRTGKAVHWIEGPWSTCKRCGPIVPRGTVHNVPLDEMAHSSVFLGPGHAIRLWIPFLWGFSPAEFDAYASLCWDTAYYLQEGWPMEFEAVFETLATSKWVWTNDKPMLMFITAVLRWELQQRQLVLSNAKIRELSTLALIGVCHYLVASSDSTASERIRLAYNPRVAVVQAVRSVL